jgi:hypothetical protein
LDAYKMLVEKHLEKYSLGSPIWRYEDRIKAG